MLKFIVPDVETTGRRTYNSQIVEVGAVVLDERFAEIERWGTLVNPGPQALALAQPKAMEVNEISEKDLEDAPGPAEAAAGFRKVLERHPEATIHSFNNEFDSWFLAREPYNVPLARWGECIMLAAMKIMEKANALGLRYNGKPKFPNLKEALAFFNLKAEATHRAVDDARAAADVYVEILRRRPRPDVGAFQREHLSIMGEGF